VSTVIGSFWSTINAIYSNEIIGRRWNRSFYL